MNVVRMPLNGIAHANDEIALHLEQQAEWIRIGQMGDVQNVFVIVEGVDGTLTRNTYGQTFDLARATGVLLMAATRAAAGD